MESKPVELYEILYTVIVHPNEQNLAEEQRAAIVVRLWAQSAPDALSKFEDNYPADQPQPEYVIRVNPVPVDGGVSIDTMLPCDRPDTARQPFMQIV